MSDFFPATRDEIMAEVARELAMRRNLFPKWVERGKIKQDEADKRIRHLQAAYDYIMETMPKNYTAKPYSY